MRHGKKPGVYVGFVHPDQVDSGWMVCLLHLFLHDTFGAQHIVNQERGGFINVGSGPRIASARNVVCSRFLDQNADWLLMLDTDMVFSPDLLDRMLEVADPDEVPILGALCFAGGKGAQIHPTMYMFGKDDEGGLISMRCESYPENELMQVNGTGGACLLVHRKVLAAMKERYETTGAAFFAETYAMGQDFGEDITFCVRAQSLGFPIHVHTGIEVGHRKLHVLDSTVYERQRKDVAEMGADAYLERYVRSMGLMEAEVRTSG